MNAIAIRPGFPSCRKVASDVEERQLEKDLISREDKERLLLKVQRHLSDEVETELGRFEVQQALLSRQIDQINDAFYEMERLPEA